MKIFGIKHYRPDNAGGKQYSLYKTLAAKH